VPRSQLAAGTNRHARDQFNAAAGNPPASPQTSTNRHFDLASGQQGSFDPQHSGDTDRGTNRGSILPTYGNDGGRHKDPAKGQLTKSVTEPEHAPASRPLTTRSASFQSSLSRLSHNFALIPKGNLLASRKFILENQDVMKENDRLFLQDAVNAMKAGMVQHPESCIEKAVLIRECSGLSSRGRREYLDDLVRSPVTAERHTFEKTCSDAYKNASEMAEQQSVIPPPSNPGPAVESGAARRVYLSKDGATVVSPASRAPREHRVTNSDPPNLSAAVAGLHISGTDRHTTEDRPQLRRNTTGTQPPVHQSKRTHSDAPNSYDEGDEQSYPLTQPTIHQSKRTHSDAPNSYDEGDEQSYPRGATSIASFDVPSVNGKIDIKGTDGDEERLDPAYKKRRDAKTFFCEGRVFAMLWHENATSTAKPGKDVQFVTKTKTTKGRYGEQIFSHIRRMVVVKQKEGYCWCLAINSYGGKGVAKTGFKETDRKAHTIIHMSTVKPFKHPEELDMDKEPIAVDMAPNQKLNNMSRLNFGGPNTVQWNVKVMNVGKVYPKSMPFLLAYWRQEMDN
jgi:hypothetical protein